MYKCMGQSFLYGIVPLSNYVASYTAAFTFGFEQTEYSFREDSELEEVELCGVIEEGGTEIFVGITVISINGTATGIVIWFIFR